MASDQTYRALQGHLDYAFQNIEILQRALTHTSAEAEHDYERLEFLGDRVLGLIIAELLLDRCPDEDEGDIGRRFAQLVRAETLTQVGRTVGVDTAITHAGEDATDGIVADATEAVIAALYLDGGYPVAAKFIERHWLPLISDFAAPPRDAKTTLQEWSQARGLGLPQYRSIAREGPDHEPVFTVEVSISGKDAARAQGSSKRAAEQQAAALLLTQLEGADAG